MLLPADLRSRLDRLALSSRARVRAQWSGRHASLHKGESLDFADYREYVPGDDFRRIDHNLWARLGQVLVRQYEAEEELPVRLVVDVSRSMEFDGKVATARVLAGMVGYLALSGGDRVLPAAIPGPGDRPVLFGPSGRHLSAWPRLELWMESLPSGGTTAISPAVRSIVGSGMVKGATVLISDLLDADWGRAIDGLATGAGGIVLHVLGTRELAPDLAGDLRLVDAETGTEVHVSTSEQTLRRYRGELERFVEGAAGRARRAGLDYLLVEAGAGAPERVLDALAGAGAIA